MSPRGDDDVLDSSAAGGVVIRGSALRVAGFVAGTAISVAASAVLLRYLGVIGAGRYTTVISLLAIVAGLTDAGLANIGIREFSARTGTSRDQFMRDILGLRLALTLAGVTLATAFAVVAGYTGPMVAGTLAGGAGLFFIVLYGTFAIPLNARLRLGAVTLLELLRNALSAVLLAGLALAGASLLALLAVPLPVGLALVLAAYPLVRRDMAWRPSISIRRWGELMRELLPYAVATAVGFLYVYLTVIVLGLVASEREVGIFSAAFRVFIVLGGASSLLAQAAFPVLARAARDDADRLAYGTQRLLEGSFVVAALAGLGTAFAAPVAIEVIAGGGGFEDAVGVLELQAVAFAGTFPAAVGAFAVLAQGRYVAVLVVNAAALVVSLGTTLALGTAEGAAVANIAGELTLLAGYLIALVTGPERIDLRLGLAPRIGLAAAAGVAAGLVAPGPSVVRTAAALGVFGVVVVLVRGVPDEIHHALLGRV
jgi:O-antigen/teichoic acid export membrane protein